MSTTPPTADPMRDDLHRSLQVARESLVWKLEGLSEYHLRRPVTPTGTNLLGLVQHVASVEAGYLGDIFGRPFPERFAWFDEDAEPNADMWVTADQSSADIIDLYHRVWMHSDATVESLPLDAIGIVPWWPEDRREVTLHRILVHITSETHRHAGHADIVRELIDGAAGLRAEALNLPDEDAGYWPTYVARVQASADRFR